MKWLNWFSKETDKGLVCPRCEESLTGHDEAKCARRMSRRYFFGAMAGGLVLAASAGPVIEAAAKLVAPPVNEFLTIEQITHEALVVLYNNTDLARRLNRKYERQFVAKIGDTIRVRKPSLYGGSYA